MEHQHLARSQAACATWLALFLASVAGTAARAMVPAAAALPANLQAPAALEAPPAAADADGEVAFLIERIVVEGVRRASPDLILEESLLTAGRTYSEAELQQAAYRIKRLPFVLGAHFSLRKGSARGRYELVITVEEINQVFLGLDSTAQLDHGLEGYGSGAVGARFFLGPHGVGYAAVEGNQARLGYTQYNLFGRRVFASVDYGRSASCCRGLTFDYGFDNALTSADVSGDQESWSLLLGFPLGPNQTVRFGVSSISVESESRFDLDILGERLRFENHSDSTTETAEVRWVWDTTDDPVVPRRGRVVSVGANADRNHVESTGATITLSQGVRTDQRSAVRSHEAGVVLAASQYWALDSRQTLGLSANLAAARAETTLEFSAVEAQELGPIKSEFSANQQRLVVTASHFVNLWGPLAARRYGDLRLETRLSSGVGLRQAEALDDNNEFLGVGLSVGLVLRNRWGLFRFTLGYELVEG